MTSTLQNLCAILKHFYRLQNLYYTPFYCPHFEASWPENFLSQSGLSVSGDPIHEAVDIHIVSHQLRHSSFKSDTIRRTRQHASGTFPSTSSTPCAAFCDPNQSSHAPSFPKPCPPNAPLPQRLSSRQPSIKSAKPRACPRRSAAPSLPPCTTVRR